MKEICGEIIILGVKGEKILSFSIERPHGYFIQSPEKMHGRRRHRKATDRSRSYGKSGDNTDVLYSEAIPVFQYLGYSQKEIAEVLDINASTLSRWKNRWKNNKKEEPLGKLQSKVVLEIDEVIAKGVKFFGSEEKFKNWLNAPNYALGNVPPLELLKDPYGIEVVENAIDGMSWGSFV